jgi:hypothetical protein
MLALHATGAFRLYVRWDDFGRRRAGVIVDAVGAERLRRGELSAIALFLEAVFGVDGTG